MTVPAGTPPLSGLRVLDFSRLFAGPYAALTLADLGAEVVKVEPPAGDDARTFGPPFLGGEGMNFMALNRGKRSIVLDLKTAGGRLAAHRLAGASDVVIENFRPGVASRLGIGEQELRAANPRLVYCAISGFGDSGGYRDRPALDIILQAMGGVMDRQGRGGRPDLMVITVADTYAAALAVQSILAALYARERTGSGQHVQVTLLEALIAAQGYRIISPAAETMLPAVDDVCPYQAFQAGDGRWLAIATVSQRNWQSLCQALGRPDLLADERFATNPSRVQHRDELIPQLETAFQARDREVWLKALKEAGVPAGPVRTVEDVLDDPWFRQQGTIIETQHPAAGRLRTLGSPLHLSATPARAHGAAPLLGQHTHEVLKEIGFSEDEIDRLASDGAIVTAVG